MEMNFLPLNVLTFLYSGRIALKVEEIQAFRLRLILPQIPTINLIIIIANNICRIRLGHPCNTPKI